MAYNNISLQAIFAFNLLLVIHLICAANDTYSHFIKTRAARHTVLANKWAANRYAHD